MTLRCATKSRLPLAGDGTPLRTTMKRLSLLFALGISLANGHANDKAVPDAAAGLADFLFAVSDVIMDHELDAPPRQQLLHLSLHSFIDDGGKGIQPRLIRRISEITTTAQLADLLRQTASPVTGLKNDEATRQRLLTGLNRSGTGNGFGGATYQGAHDYRVARQLSENRYVGIGIALGMTSTDGNGRPVVERLLGKGPAYYSGLLQGDQMLEIDGRDTKGKNLREVLLWLRGADGSKVELIVQQKPRDPKRKIVITRSVVPILSATGWSEETPGEHEYRIDHAPEFAYVRIEKITGATLNELQSLEAQFAEHGVKGVILDLRNTNPTQEGGVHPACILADGLIPGGQLGTIHEHGRARQLRAEPDAVFRNLPMVAMVGPGTRGAAEWLAAALQDNERALIVGRPTMGITKIKRSIPLPGHGGALLLNTARLERSDQEAREASRKKGRDRRRGTAGITADSVYPDRVVANADPRSARASVLRAALEYLKSK